MGKQTEYCKFVLIQSDSFFLPQVRMKYGHWKIGLLF